MILSLCALRDLLTGGAAPRSNRRQAPTARLHVEQLEGRELPAPLLPTPLRVLDEGHGGAQIGVLTITSQTRLPGFKGTDFSGTYQDWQFNGGQGIVLNISGHVSGLSLPKHPGLATIFSGQSAQVLLTQGEAESEDITFTGDYNRHTQTMTGTLSQTFVELIFYSGPVQTFISGQDTQVVLAPYQF
jgi:hypothetical protein